ncbi:MAG: hypothetical protein V1792_21615 [Pseudomonadota bacterium]
MEFSTTEEFRIKAHECFNRIFELLVKVDGVAKEGAEREEANGKYGEMSELRDWVEEIILQCHLAWQYHRLSRGPESHDTWDAVENTPKQENPGK